MVKHIFCIKDELVGFTEPFFLEPNSDVAIRKFKYSMMRMLHDEDFSAPVDDFNLYELGIFNRKNGSFEIHEPRLIYQGCRVVYDVEKELEKEKKENEISNNV